jgi:biopolymer transport protein ExbB/TolQ
VSVASVLLFAGIVFGSAYVVLKKPVNKTLHQFEDVVHEVHDLHEM